MTIEAQRACEPKRGDKWVERGGVYEVVKVTQWNVFLEYTRRDHKGDVAFRLPEKVSHGEYLRRVNTFLRACNTFYAEKERKAARRAETGTSKEVGK